MFFNISHMNREKANSFSSSNSNNDSIDSHSNSIDELANTIERRSNSIDSCPDNTKERTSSIDYTHSDYEDHIKNKWVKRHLSGKIGICENTSIRIRDSYTITNNHIDIAYTPPRCNFLEYMQLLDASYNYIRK